jgi:hypothetical protein
MDHPRTYPDVGFQVDPWVHFLGGLVERRPGLWTRLGDLETRMLGAELTDVEIKAPIYVAGMARSGSTLLLEVLEQPRADRQPSLPRFSDALYAAFMEPFSGSRAVAPPGAGGTRPP